ncbi:hypothetical protein pb186bvf_006683 [Paramecium bursaria]
MSSLFVKCQQCNQRPATIKCGQCRNGQIFRLCYSCDSQVHNRSGPIDQQHKTEIIPYQGIKYLTLSPIEMYQKANQNQQQQNQQQQADKNSNFFQQQKPQRPATSQPVPQQQLQANRFAGITKQPVKEQFKEIPKEQPTKDNKNPFYKTTKEQIQPAKEQVNYSGQRSSNKQRYDDEPQYSSSKNSDQKNLLNQLKEQQEENQLLRKEMNNQKEILSKEFDKKIQLSQKDLQKKIDQLLKENQEEKKKAQSTQQLQDELKKLKDQLRVAEQNTQKKLDQQKRQFEQQIADLEAVVQEKQEQLDEIAQEFSNYNLEEIQAKMEEMANENNMKDQIIEELQNQLNNGQKGNGAENDEDFQGDKEDLLQQIEAKDSEIKKLEELIENFKQLYQHMLDEKQVIMDENEKLANENNQFRDIFSQNLHLFGIDPNQLEAEEGEGEEGDEYQHEEGRYVRQSKKMKRPMIRHDKNYYNIQQHFFLFSFIILLNSFYQNSLVQFQILFNINLQIVNQRFQNTEKKQNKIQQKMEEQIYQCVMMALMLGFESARKTNLPYKLENITCDGQTAMRDAVVKGTSMLLQLRELHIEMELPNLWQFVHIVITDGADNQSEISKEHVLALMEEVGDNVPPEHLKTIYVGVDLKKNDSALQELEELTSVGGRGAELKNIKADEMDSIFQKIKISLLQRVQIRQLSVQADNKQIKFTQFQMQPQIQIEMSVGQWQEKDAKAVREILGSLGDDDMVCGIVFNDKCHVASQINTQAWNREIYQRREEQRQQEEAKQRAEAEAEAEAQRQRDQQQWQNLCYVQTTVTYKDSSTQQILPNYTLFYNIRQINYINYNNYDIITTISFRFYSIIRIKQILLQN